jgi:hypothetical protein
MQEILCSGCIHNGGNFAGLAPALPMSLFYPNKKVHAVIIRNKIDSNAAFPKKIIVELRFVISVSFFGFD